MLRHPPKNPLWICVALVVFLSSCGSLAKDYRVEGFNMLHKGFSSMEESPDLHEYIILKNVKIHIVGHRKHFCWEEAKGAEKGIVGYATTENEIWLFGKEVNGKIILNQGVLGHELNHLLNFKDPKIANPDKLDDLGV